MEKYVLKEKIWRVSCQLYEEFLYSKLIIVPDFCLSFLKNNNFLNETQKKESKQLLVSICNYYRNVEYYDQNNWHLAPLLLELPEKQEKFELQLLGLNSNNLYAFGGCCKNNSTNKMWKRDLSQQSFQWEEMRSMKKCRENFSSVVFKNNIYVFGGIVKKDVLNSCECYDSEHNVWRDVEPMNFPRYSASATVYNDKIYIAGGYNENNEVEKSMEMYDLKKEKWVLVESMNTARRNFSLTNFENRLWAIGGHDNNEILSTVESYDFEKKSWILEKPLNEKRYLHAAINFKNELYVVGGWRKKKCM